MLEGSEVTGKNKHALGTGIRTMYGIGLSNDRCYIHIYYYIIIYYMHDILTDPNHGTCILVCLAFAQTSFGASHGERREDHPFASS